MVVGKGIDPEVTLDILEAKVRGEVMTVRGEGEQGDLFKR